MPARKVSYCKPQVNIIMLIAFFRIFFYFNAYLLIAYDVYLCYNFHGYTGAVR